MSTSDSRVCQRGNRWVGSPVSRRIAASVVSFGALCAALSSAAHGADGGRFGLGRAPTPSEIAAWDIDVRPDYAGLPKGSGSVARGQDIWEAKCASCHGIFGESNEVFNPIIGGTTADDVKTGRVKSLTTSELQRTTMMKLPSLAPLWDYIRRAMPWNAPKSLSTDDVYAVTAYILHLADLVPASFVLSDANIRQTDKLLPNRNGMTRAHGMWDVRGKPDVRNVACMTNCATPKVLSSMPDHARDAHGNLAEQNRSVGGARGADTTRPALAFAASGQTSGVPAARGDPHPMVALATREGCMTCHGIDRRIVGPSFREIAAKLGKGAAASASALAAKIRAGGSGVWGAIPMPPQAQLAADDAEALAAWIIGGAGQK